MNHPKITKPCPFCGAVGVALKLGQTDNDGRGAEFCYVYCSECHAEGPPVTMKGRMDWTPQESALAVYQWNERPLDAAVDALVAEGSDDD